MPWSEISAEEQRKGFVDEWMAKDATVTQLCERFGVSRQTGYKWIRRFKEEGQRGLGDRSRAPLSHPNAANAEVRELLLRAREKHPSREPRKLLERLRRDMPEVSWPAPSTVGDLVSRAGLVKPRRRSQARYRPASTLTPADEPNAVWCIDVKGWFRTQDGECCNPLTITDQHSRYLIECRHLDRVTHENVQKVLERCFREHGLPLVMRSDNGPPFGVRGLGGLSRLSLWLVRLGIRPEHIQPGKPQKNGAHERMHRTLRAETAHPPESTLARQQRVFDRFRRSTTTCARNSHSPATHPQIASSARLARFRRGYPNSNIRPASRSVASARTARSDMAST